MNNFIIIDGVKHYHQKKLEFPRKDDFFVVTGEIKFGGVYQDTGHFNEAAFAQAQIEHGQNSREKCENKQGYFCKNEKCNYPKCLIHK